MSSPSGPTTAASRPESLASPIVVVRKQCMACSSPTPWQNMGPVNATRLPAALPIANAISFMATAISSMSNSMAAADRRMGTIQPLEAQVGEEM